MQHTNTFDLFTTGRIAFIVFFVIVFIAGLIWAYRKDLKVNRIHFKGSYLILAAIILIFTLLFLIVKFKHGLVR